MFTLMRNFPIKKKKKPVQGRQNTILQPLVDIHLPQARRKKGTQRQKKVLPLPQLEAHTVFLEGPRGRSTLAILQKSQKG